MRSTLLKNVTADKIKLNPRLSQAISITRPWSARTRSEQPGLESHRGWCRYWESVRRDALLDVFRYASSRKSCRREERPFHFHDDLVTRGPIDRKSIQRRGSGWGSRFLNRRNENDTSRIKGLLHPRPPLFTAEKVQADFGIISLRDKTEKQRKRIQDSSESWKSELR